VTLEGLVTTLSVPYQRKALRFVGRDDSGEIGRRPTVLQGAAETAVQLGVGSP